MVPQLKPSSNDASIWPAPYHQFLFTTSFGQHTQHTWHMQHAIIFAPSTCVDHNLETYLSQCVFLSNRDGIWFSYYALNELPKIWYSTYCAILFGYDECRQSPLRRRLPLQQSNVAQSFDSLHEDGFVFVQDKVRLAMVWLHTFL